MKKLNFLFASLLMCLLLISCSGSDAYRGEWKALDPAGNKSILKFDAKSFVIRDETGSEKKYDYSQNKVSIENGVKTYGIKLSDGRGYEITFPNSKDQSVGLLTDENGRGLYTISRKNYISYDDIYKLK